VEVTVTNFIQKQIDASERLFHMMVEDNKQRMRDLQMWVEMNESFQKKLAERDAEIARLRGKLALFEVGEKL